MPVIPVAQEAETGGLQVQSQPQHKSEVLSGSVRPYLSKKRGGAGEKVGQGKDFFLIKIMIKRLMGKVSRDQRGKETCLSVYR